MSIDLKAGAPLRDEEWAPLFHGPIAAGITQSIEAIRRDLPELMKAHRGQWVVYRGGQCLGFGRTETELYQACLHQGLSLDEFFVGLVEERAMDWPDEYEVTCEKK